MLAIPGHHPGCWRRPNVGEPIAHTARDVVRTLFRAKDLRCVIMVGEDGLGREVARADRQ